MPDKHGQLVVGDVVTVLDINLDGRYADRVGIILPRNEWHCTWSFSPVLFPETSQQGTFPNWQLRPVGAS